MKRFAFAGLAIFPILFFAQKAFSFREMYHGFSEPQRQSLSDVNYSNFKSTSLASCGSGSQGYVIQISSGVTRVDSIIVSSAGVNSKIVVYDSRIYQGQVMGNCTWQVNGWGDMTNTNNAEIPFHYVSSTQGVVIISTNAGGGTWIGPVIRVIGERIR